MILAISLALVFTSCSSPVTKESLIGKWKVVNYQANIENLSPSLINSANEIALSQIYIFESDGSFRIESEEIFAREEGGWTMSEDLKILTLTPNMSSGGQEQEVALFEAEKLVLVLQMGELGNETTTLKKQ